MSGIFISHINNFNGTIDGKSIKDIYKSIDYSKLTIEERKKVIENIINENDTFFTEYFDEHFVLNNEKVTMNSETETSEWNTVCKLLETMSFYLVSSPDIKEEEKRLYRPKEDIKGTQIESIEITPSSKNYRLDPPMSVTKYDYFAKDVFNCTYEEYVKQYNKFNDKLGENSNKNYFMSKDVWENAKRYNEEMILLLDENKRNKDKLYKEFLRLKSIDKTKLNEEELINLKRKLRIIGNSLKACNENAIDIKRSFLRYIHIDPLKCKVQKPDLDCIDFTNKKHIRVLLNYKEIEITPDNDLSLILYDFNKIIKEMKAKKLLNEKQIELINLLQEGLTITEISRALKINRRPIYSKIDVIVNKIQKYLIYEKRYKMYNE